MKVLITGGTGLLGRNLIETMPSSCEATATYLGDYQMRSTPVVQYQKLDIRDKEGYARLFQEFNPEIVIHTASIGSPDYAEKNKTETQEINIGGTQNIIANCERFKAKFIFVSSNGIYDGDNAPYAEEDEAMPVNYYGQIKLEGERISKNAAVPFAIVRPILMYGWNNPHERDNIITSSLKKLKQREVVYVYEDVFYNPVPARFCAQAIWKIIQTGKFDTFNIGGRDIVSVYEFVQSATKIFDLDLNLVQPIKQEFLKELVKRPKNTSYQTKKMENILGLVPLSIKEGLEIMREEGRKNNYV
jgi:dTDP-4-dehydrorhamnose reductase